MLEKVNKEEILEIIEQFIKVFKSSKGLERKHREEKKDEESLL